MNSEEIPGSAPPGRLARRFLVGGAYLGAGNWLSYAINFALTLGIMRLLGPAEFGLYAFVFAFNEFLNIVGAFSLGVVLIQAREAEQELFDTALVLLLGLGLLGLLIGIPVAFVLGHLRSPEAAWILIALCVVRIFRLLAQVPDSKLERDLRYGPITVISLVTGNVPNAMALGLAWAGIGAWSLVARDLLTVVAQFGLSMAWSGYRFRFAVRRDAARTLMRVGHQLFAAMGVGLVTERVDRVALGFAFGDATTGLYQNARFLAETGLLVLRPVSRLSLNLFAKLQDDPARLSRGFELVSYVMARALVAGAVALFVFPRDVIGLLVGDEWLEAAPMLRWFSLFAVTCAMNEIPRGLFMGSGHTRLFVRLAVVQASLIVPGVLVSAALGSRGGIVASVVGGTTLAFAFGWLQSRQLVSASLKATFAVPLLAGVLVAAALHVAAVEGVLEPLPSIVRIATAPCAFALAVSLIEGRRLLGGIRFLRSQM